MIYWDYNATAPLRPLVKERVQWAMDRFPGNPSSSHALGQEAKAYIEKVRRKFADKIGVKNTELIFTGSATESNLMAMQGFWLAQKKVNPKRNRALVSQIEHAAIGENLELLRESFGIEVEPLPLSPECLIDLQRTEDLLKTGDFFLCTLQGASNETGVVQPWQELAQLCEKYDTPFHSDMVQVLGRLPLSLKDLAPCSATFAFHKSGGLKGVGALYLKQGRDWQTCLRGGAQEKKRRAGTENIVGIASIDALIDEMDQMVDTYQTQVRSVRDSFEKQLKERIPDVRIVGDCCNRLPNTSYCIFQGVPSDAMLMSLDVNNICASAGSACSSGLALASKPLVALGYSPEESQSAVRFSLGESSSYDQIDTVINVIEATIKRLAA